MVSDDEKHELILAHAAAREARGSWGLGYYVAVAASCLVVVSGWWLTLQSNVRGKLFMNDVPSTSAPAPAPAPQPLMDQIRAQYLEAIRTATSTNP